MCCNSDDVDNSSTMTAAAGIDEAGNRALDLSDLGLVTGLAGNQELLNLARASAGSDADLKDLNTELAQDMANSRRNIFDPLEARIVLDAETYDSPERMQQEIGRADAAVMQAYDKATRSGDRNMLRLGVTPNSGKAMAARENMNFDRAMAGATAGNRAVSGLKEKGFGMRMAAAGLGKDKASTQINASNSALALGQSAVSSLDRALDSQRDVFTQANNGLGTAANAFGRSAQVYGDASRASQQQQAQDDANTGSLIGLGLGQIFNSGGGGLSC
jgi:hypothetical protein